MRTRSFRGADLGRDGRRSDDFDPIAEGARHHLTEDVSIKIWQRVRTESADGFGRFDDDRARRRFHIVAARVARRGGRLHPDPNKLTRRQVATWNANPLWNVFADIDPCKVTRADLSARPGTRGNHISNGNPSDRPGPTSSGCSRGCRRRGTRGRCCPASQLRWDRGG